MYNIIIGNYNLFTLIMITFCNFANKRENKKKRYYRQHKNLKCKIKMFSETS